MDPVVSVLMQRLEKAWSNNPEFRLGQLICGAVSCDVLYDISDADLSEALENVYGPLEIDA